VPNFASTDKVKYEPIPIKNKRYQIPRYHLDGPMEPGAEPVQGQGMLVPWTRVSTIIDVHKNKEGIFDWRSRNIVAGLSRREDLIALGASAPLIDKATLRDVARQAEEFAKSKSSANLGTALHTFRERTDNGEPLDIVPAPWRADIVAYREALATAGVEIIPELQELVVVRPDLADGDAGGLAGRFDLIVRHNGQLKVADLKTGSDPLEYGSWDIQQQLGVYTTAWAIWDGQCWNAPPDVARDSVLMIHLLPGQATAAVYEIPVDQEELEADLAAAYRTRRRRAQVKKLPRLLAAVLEEPHPAAARVTVTPQMEADAEKAQERQAAINGTKLDAHEPPPGAEPGALTLAEAAAVPVLNGEGKPLEPLAGPGERGCGTCGRKGHRKGSPKCLGDKDPGTGRDARNAMLAEGKTGEQVYAEDAERRAAAGVCAHGAWTKVGDSWECGECGAPAAAPIVTELEATLAAQTEPDPMTPAEDEFADEVLSDSEARWHEFLDEVNEAPDKATLRDIRARAQEAGVWDDKLKAAGLERVKNL
jgi:rubredoxin